VAAREAAALVLVDLCAGADEPSVAVIAGGTDAGADVVAVSKARRGNIIYVSKRKSILGRPSDYFRSSVRR
jgi:hypothetical protein